MEKISRTIMLMVPECACNLQCSYCYEWKKSGERVEFQYPVETIIQAFRKERIGGYAEVVVVGFAETLIRDDVIEVIHGLLQEGHIVHVVTNASLSGQVDKLLSVDNKDILKNLIFKASFHYLELKKKRLLDVYFDNINKVLNTGASAYPFLVVSDEYAPHIEEIAELFIERLGNTPHCSPCINFRSGYDMDYLVDMQALQIEDKVRSIFESKIYEEIIRYSKVNVQKCYCYAGKWSYKVDMSTGVVHRCHGLPTKLNFFENIDERFDMDDVVACSCGIATCALQYNFFALGLIPEVPCKYQYGDLLYKTGFVTEYVRERLNVNLAELYPGDTIERKYEKCLLNKNIQLENCLNIIDWMNRTQGERGLNYSDFLSNPFVNRRIYDAIDHGFLVGIYGTGGTYLSNKWAINFKVSFFVSTGACEEDTFEGIKVYSPDKLSMIPDAKFIVIASKNRDQITNTLEYYGYVEGKDFI